MRTLNYIVKGQNIIRDSKCDFSNIAKGTHNYIKLVFDFDGDWRDKAKVIELKSCDGEQSVITLQNKVVLPEKITKGSVFSFSLYGKNGDEKIHTNTEYVEQV